MSEKCSGEGSSSKQGRTSMKMNQSTVVVVSFVCFNRVTNSDKLNHFIFYKTKFNNKIVISNDDSHKSTVLNTSDICTSETYKIMFEILNTNTFRSYIKTNSVSMAQFSLCSKDHRDYTGIVRS